MLLISLTSIVTLGIYESIVRIAPRIDLLFTAPPTPLSEFFVEHVVLFVKRVHLEVATPHQWSLFTLAALRLRHLDSVIVRFADAKFATFMVKTHHVEVFQPLYNAGKLDGTYEEFTSEGSSKTFHLAVCSISFGLKLYLKSCV
jgi:hypothetical protein